MLGVYASGSRGAVLGLSIAIPLTIALWIARYLKNNPNSLVGPIVMVSLTGLVLGVITLALAWRRFQVLFTGGAEGASSTDTRFAQWQLAQKWIISNPVTGHGSGLSGPLVGFYNPGGTVPSVDSYIISLLVEVGFVGFLSFFGMLVAAICVLVYVYLTDNEESSNCAGAIAAALTSFMIYRLALSQRENHVLLFLLVGIAIAEVAASLRRRAERQRSAGMLPAAAPLGVRS
jgi:O-antigen ligase